MKFLIAVPRFITRPGQYYEFPLGLAYISSALKQAGHEVHTLNLNHSNSSPSDAVAGAIRDFDPDVCASGTLSPHYAQVKTIFEAARAAKPSVVNIAGGGVFSGDPELMSRVLDIDYGVIGEGEETAVELAQVLEAGDDPEGVPGIAFRNGKGRFIQTLARPAIRDIDAIAWPDYEGLGLEAYLATQRRSDNYFFHTEGTPRSLPLISGRSCPFNCTFCFHPTGRFYRKRGLDGLFAEIDFLVATYRPRMVSFLDELFALKKSDLMEFCARIKPYGLRWMVSLHVTTVDEEVLTAMKDAGCTYISYGIENVSADILASMNKKTTREQIERALALTYENRIGIQGNFIFGDPAETFDTANETLDWWSRNRRYQLNLSRLQVYPGSIVHSQALEKNLIADREAQLHEPCLNVTGIDDDATGKMRMKLMVFGETLLLPARIRSFEKRPEPDPVRGEVFDIVADCPHCNETNELDGILFDASTAFQSLRLTCCHCYGRFDVQNLARRPWPDERLDDLYRKAAGLRAARNLQQAFSLYSEILRTSFPGQVINRPDAYIQAAFDVGTIFQASNQNPQGAVYHFGRALFLRAFDPNYHLAFAQALMAEECFGAARMHFEQVLRLVEATENSVPSAQLDAIRNVIAALPEGDHVDAYFRPAGDDRQHPVAA